MAQKKNRNQITVIVGLTVALIFVLLGVFVFSYAMETLDAKAEQLGVEEHPIYEAPLYDYNLAGNENQWVTLLIAITSTLLLFVAGLAVAKLINKKKSRQQ